MHIAIPTKDNETLHDGSYAHRCITCIAMADVLVLSNNPRVRNRSVGLGDVVQLKPESRGSGDPDRVTITAMRLNTHTGEVWMHAFALGENRILQAADVEMIVDISTYTDPEGIDA